MTKIVKSQWTTDGNTVRMSMPFAKVDQQNRLVSGFATLDNVDSQGDVVLAEASAKAFARARGNIREMHQPLAVGRIVDFREDEFYDTEEQKFYRGVYVTARVSLGAEDTWQKVLDGTLSGFSIGGNIIDATNEFNKDSGTTVRFIKDYELVELSLVDNPANQLANVFSIQKSASGSVIKGMVADTVIENVFYCINDKEIQAKSTESATCLECGSEMKNIGWFESGNDRAEKVNDVVAKFLSQNAADENSETGEGGVEMAKKDTTDESVETGHEAGEETEVPVPAESDDVPAEEEAAVDVEETDEAEEENAEDVEEVTDDEEVISKKIDELKDAVHESLEKSRNDTAEQVKALEKKIDEINDSFTKKASELESKLGEFGQKLETAKSRLSAFEKSLDAINSSEAFRKSADSDDEPVQNVQKSKTTWNGAFSIDNLL